MNANPSVHVPRGTRRRAPELPVPLPPAHWRGQPWAFRVRRVLPGVYICKALGARSGFGPGSEGFGRARHSAGAA